VSPKRLTTRLAACATILLSAAPAWAQVSPMDIQVAGRALSFLAKPLTGEVTVGIVYSPTNSLSQQSAQDLQKQLGSGLRVGNLTLKPALVTLADAARSKAGFFFLTPGVGTEAAALPDITKAKHIPCVTTDLGQVTAGRCTVGVRSTPKIEIVVNRAAAAASGTTFSTVFRMMITEL
jgi:hypothetical protein